MCLPWTGLQNCCSFLTPSTTPNDRKARNSVCCKGLIHPKVPGTAGNRKGVVVLTKQRSNQQRLAPPTRGPPSTRTPEPSTPGSAYVRHLQGQGRHCSPKRVMANTKRAVPPRAPKHPCSLPHKKQ